MKSQTVVQISYDDLVRETVCSQKTCDIDKAYHDSGDLEFCHKIALEEFLIQSFFPISLCYISFRYGILGLWNRKFLGITPEACSQWVSAILFWIPVVLLYIVNPSLSKEPVLGHELGQ